MATDTRMRDRLLKALLIMLWLGAPALAQTPDDLRHKYGKPKTLSHKSSEILVERYAVTTDIILTVKFADRLRACHLRIEPTRAVLSGAVREPVVPTDAAYKLTEELAPASERGRLIKSTNVELGCSTVVYEEYERVMIATASRCTQQSGGVYSVNIRWKERACEQIDRRTRTPQADGSLE